MRGDEGFATYCGPLYQIHDIVDCRGSGDSFLPGIICGLMNFKQSPQDVMNFAPTLGVLKHTIRGDVCLVTESEGWEILKTKASGKVIP